LFKFKLKKLKMTAKMAAQNVDWGKTEPFTNRFDSNLNCMRKKNCQQIKFKIIGGQEF